MVFRPTYGVGALMDEARRGGALAGMMQAKQQNFSALQQAAQRAEQQAWREKVFDADQDWKDKSFDAQQDFRNKQWDRNEQRYQENLDLDERDYGLKLRQQNFREQMAGARSRQKILEAMMKNQPKPMNMKDAEKLTEIEQKAYDPAIPIAERQQYIDILERSGRPVYRGELNPESRKMSPTEAAIEYKKSISPLGWIFGEDTAASNFRQSQYGYTQEDAYAELAEVKATLAEMTSAIQKAKADGKEMPQVVIDQYRALQDRAEQLAAIPSQVRPDLSLWDFF